CPNARNRSAWCRRSTGQVADGLRARSPRLRARPSAKGQGQGGAFRGASSRASLNGAVAEGRYAVRTILLRIDSDRWRGLRARRGDRPGRDSQAEEEAVT